VTPAHQYPTGAVLAPERRAALLDWSSQRGAFIIEDDYDAEYRYDREPIGSLQGLAPDRVVYMGTASKMLSPALRLAWLALPADLANGVRRAKLEADRGSPVLDQLALTDFLNRGELDRHLRKTRLIYRARRDELMDALRTYLPHIRAHGVAAGLHVMIELGRDADEQKIVEAAARQSIRICGASIYRAKRDAGPPALVLGYGALQEGTVDEAVRILATVLREHDVRWIPGSE
jgi:GntR family transcriptional regulator/MocR family aminotransferase